MNSTDTNAGGWEASQMRAYLNGDWRTQLPQDLDAVIVPVDKLSNNVGETDAVSAVTTTSDALWLFSLSELAGAVPAGRTGEGYGLFEEGYVDVLDAAGDVYKRQRFRRRYAVEGKALPGAAARASLFERHPRACVRDHVLHRLFSPCIVGGDTAR